MRVLALCKRERGVQVGLGKWNLLNCFQDNLVHCLLVSNARGFDGWRFQFGERSELIAAAASYEAAKAWEKHEANHGKPSSHEKAKELLAGAIGAFVDREVETKGRDWIDKEKVKRDARKQAEEQLANHYWTSRWLVVSDLGHNLIPWIYLLEFYRLESLRDRCWSMSQCKVQI